MNELIGRYFRLKWTHRAAESGIEHTARMMRKQGVPLAFALIILVGRV